MNAAKALHDLGVWDIGSFDRWGIVLGKGARM